MKSSLRLVVSMIVMILAMGATALQPAQAQTLPDEVEIKVRLFIPAPILDWPGMDPFGGDNRGFGYGNGTSRLNLTFRIDSQTGRVVPGSVQGAWGKTTKYRESDTEPVPGKPTWWDQLKSFNTTPRAEETLPFNSNNVTITNTSGGVRVKIEGMNPLQFGAPAIDANFTVKVTQSGGFVKTEVDGRHDGFPNYEIYSDQVRIHEHDVEAAGKNPANLFPPMDHRIDAERVREVDDVVPGPQAGTGGSGSGSTGSGSSGSGSAGYAGTSGSSSGTAGGGSSSGSGSSSGTSGGNSPGWHVYCDGEYVGTSSSTAETLDMAYDCLASGGEASVT